MIDDPIGSGEFNAAMKRVEVGLDGLSRRLAAVEGLQQASLLARIKEAEEQGARNADLKHIEKRLDRLSMGLGLVAAGFVGQLLWWGFQKVAH